MNGKGCLAECLTVRNRLLWILFVLLLLLLVGWGVRWFFDNFERGTRDVVQGISPAARKNPLLAAERFLNRLDIATESISGRDQLLKPPAEPGLLLVYRLGSSLPAEREQALLDWVRGGGHLLVAPQQAWDEETETSGNSLLDRLGVQPVFQDSEGDESDLEASDSAPDEGAVPALVRFRMPGVSGPMAVAFNPQRQLFDRLGHAQWAVETAQGSHLLQYALGRGNVTVMSDLQPFSNGSIGEHDHALLLALLAGEQRRVWLLYSSAMPSLPVLLWRHASGLVVSLSTLVLLLLWWLTRRSGPLRSGEQPPRRNLMEHLAAVGRYLWRIDRAVGTFRQSQLALEQAWQRRHPVLGGLQQRGRCEWIAKYAGLSPRAVEQALYGDYQGEQEFIRVTITQQRLAAQLRLQKKQQEFGGEASG